MAEPTNMGELLHQLGTRRRQLDDPFGRGPQPFHPSQIYVDPDVDEDGLDDWDRALLNQQSPDRASEAAQGRGRLSLPPVGEGPVLSDHTNRQPARSLFSDSTQTPPSPAPYISRPTRLPSRQPLRPLTQTQTPPNRQRETHSSSPFFTQSSPTPVRPPRSQDTRSPQQSSQQDVQQRPPLLSFENVQPPESAPPIMPMAPPQRPVQTPVVQGITLIPLSELPDSFSNIFPYRLFNAVQSKCFPHLVESDDNFVMSAPTGSGKTVILELAIARLMLHTDQSPFKVVYLAPTKALCSERHKDWTQKFQMHNLVCAELTGDTAMSQAIDSIQKAHILIATPEKWDSTTRKWKENRQCMDLVKLVLIDEVHMLKDHRGATLEAVVARMKTMGAGVRFVALSATVPNANNVATWLRKNSDDVENPARLEVFGEEFRPVKLEKHVYGFRSAQDNDWSLDETFNRNLPQILNKHSRGQPILIFCSTRASCAKTAKLLRDRRSSDKNAQTWWTVPRQPLASGDAELNELLRYGVAYHHAGLSANDRIMVEQGFISGEVCAICCTSTLAVGVNTPCHLAVIKGTMNYTDEGLKEYSDLDIMQMIGRAGRPQFSHQGAVAVVMTSNPQKEKYQRLAAGQEPLESCLHLNLIEHLNAEISLGTITNIASAQAWLAGTFFAIRLGQNSRHYHIAFAATSGQSDAMELINTICQQNVTGLLKENLVIGHENKLASTAFGQAMSRYCIRFKSMQRLLKIKSRARYSEILSSLVEAEEFKDIRLQAADGNLYKTLNTLPGIRFPLDAVKAGSHKCSLIIQTELGNIDLPGNVTKQARGRFNQSKIVLFRDIHRLIRCVIDCKVALEDAEAVRHGLDLARSLSARVWDDWPENLTQLPTVGPATFRKLVGLDIKSITDLAEADPARINMKLNSSNMGEKLVSLAKSFPLPIVTMTLVDDKVVVAGAGPVVHFKIQIGFMSERPPLSFNKIPVYVCLIVERSDGHLVLFRRMRSAQSTAPINMSADLSAPGQSIICRVMCDEFAGTMQSAQISPNVPASLFPALETAVVPKTLTERKALEKSAMISSKEVSRKNSAQSRGSTAAGKEDNFGLDDVDEADLLAVESQSHFQPIEEIEAGVKPRAKRIGSLTQTKQAGPRVLMNNGKYECNHSCKDKTLCKHSCCREGLDKPPRPSKSDRTAANTEDKKEGKKRQATLAELDAKPAKSQITSQQLHSDDSLDLVSGHQPAKRRKGEAVQATHDAVPHSKQGKVTELFDLDEDPIEEMDLLPEPSRSNAVSGPDLAKAVQVLDHEGQPLEEIDLIPETRNHVATESPGNLFPSFEAKNPNYDQSGTDHADVEQYSSDENMPDFDVLMGTAMTEGPFGSLRPTAESIITARQLEASRPTFTQTPQAISDAKTKEDQSESRGSAGQPFKDMTGIDSDLADNLKDFVDFVDDDDNC